MALLETSRYLGDRRYRKAVFTAVLAIANASTIPAFVFVTQVGLPRYFAFFAIIAFGLLLLDVLLLVSPSEIHRVLSLPPVLRPLLDHRFLVVILAVGIATFALVGRDLAFYLVMATFFTLVLIRAFVVESSGERIGSLTLVVAGSFLLIVSQIASFLYFHRTADTILHTALSVRIARTGFIRTADPGRYGNLPVFHAVMASLIQLTVGHVRVVIGLAVGALFQSAVVAMYVILRKFNQSTGVSLSGALLMGISTPFLAWGTSNHVQSLSFVLFMVFLMIILARFNDRRTIAILVPIILTWVLTHQFTLLMAILFIGFPLCILYLYLTINRIPIGNPVKTTSIRLAILVIAQLSYWTIVTQIFREPIAWFLYTSPSAQDVSTRGYLVEYYSEFWSLVSASLPEIIDKIQHGFWIAIAALGLWSVVESVDRSKVHLLVALLGFPLAAIFFFPNPFWAPLQGSAMVLRWRLFALPFVLLMPALGIRTIMSVDKQTLRAALIVLVIGSLVFFTISSILFSPNITDIAGYDKRSVRYLDEPDFSAMDYVFEYTTGSQVSGTTMIPIYMEEYDYRYKRGVGDHFWVIANLSEKEILFQPGLNVIEKDSFTTGLTRVVVSTDPVILAPVSEDMVTLNETKGSRIYDNKATEIYFTHEPEGGVNS